MEESERVPLLLWPFWAIWRLVTLIIGLTGRLIAIVLGLVLMVVGTLLNLTGIGAIIGVPMLLFGLLLVIRGFF